MAVGDSFCSLDLGIICFFDCVLCPPNAPISRSMNRLPPEVTH